MGFDMDEARRTVGRKFITEAERVGSAIDHRETCGSSKWP
jgi:hypothetical protein